jgi:hypothetical protein
LSGALVFCVAVRGVCGEIAVAMEVLNTIPAVVDVDVADHLGPSLTRTELDDLLAEHTFSPITRFNETADCAALPRFGRWGGLGRSCHAVTIGTKPRDIRFAPNGD